VRFRCESHEPVPYQRCYCGICRKAGGGGGYLVNLGGDATTLEVEGREHVAVYRAMVDRGDGPVRSKHERHFCRACGCHLWAFHPNWPELLHPVAGAIDTPLPEPPERVHMMVGSKASWVALEEREGDERFEAYPRKSLADWHRSRGLG
jgi:hypothetical protein